MKPEVGGLGIMAQEEFDPLDMLSKVATLVLEARTPHPSAKGRVEGPHCSVASEQRGQHLCCPEMPQCAQAQEAKRRIDAMWRKGVPSCMDILLFPNCSHGRAEARSLDGAGNDFEENALLLERWSITCVTKWNGAWTEGVAGSMLLQAVRSYLYFSQLSSWLASMHGHLPSQVGHRLYAPGDCGDIDFTDNPNKHVFPTAVYGRYGVKVAVLHLPRLDRFPDLRCALDNPGVCVGGLGRWQYRKDKEEEGAAEGGKSEPGGIRKRGGTAWYAKPSGSRSGMSSPVSPQGSHDIQQMAQDWKPSTLDSTWFTRDNVESDKEERKPFQDYARSEMYQTSSAKGDRFPHNIIASFPDEVGPAEDDEDDGAPFQDSVRYTQDNRRTAQNNARLISDKRRPTKDSRKLLQTSMKPFQSSKRPAESSSSSSPRSDSSQSRPSKCQQSWIADANVVRSQMKGDLQGKVRVKKQSTRESLESQLRPLELTPPTSAQCLDLHSPKVLMSDVFYNPVPATRRMQLDFSHPYPTPHIPGGPQHLNDKAFLMQHFEQGTSGLLSHMELSTILCNLRSFGGPVPSHPLDPTQSLSYKIAADKAERLGMSATDWDWSQVQTPVRHQDGGDREQYGARFYKKALLFGRDPPASTLTGSSAGPSATESAQNLDSELMLASIAADPLKAREQPMLNLGKAHSVGTNTLKRTSPELPARKVKVKKREGTAMESREDNSGLLESRTSPPESGEGSAASLHSIPSSLSESVNQTVRDLGKIVQAKNSQTGQSSLGLQKMHPAIDALSTSWSSSSSSSSSTYSSSPKVSTGSGDIHSDSSTPTNLSASPLPEEQQSMSYHVKPSVDVSSLSPHSDTATCTENSRTYSSGQDGAELDSCSTANIIDPGLTYKSKKIQETYSRDCQYQEDGDQRLQNEADSSLATSCYCCDTQNIEHCDKNRQLMSESGSTPYSLHSTASLVSHCDEFLTDVPFKGKDCVQLPLCSDTKRNESTSRYENSPEKAQSPCKFYLESPTSPENVTPVVSQWQRVLDKKVEEDGELTSLLQKLCLRQTEHTSQSVSCPTEEPVEPQLQPNGCGVDTFAKCQSRVQSNGHLFSNVVQNGSQSCSSVTNQPSSLTSQQTRSQWLDAHSACDFSLVTDNSTSSAVSISNSSVVPSCQEKTADQIEPSTKSTVEMPCSCSSLENSFLLCSNGAIKSTERAAVDSAPDGNDSVFFDKSMDIKDGVLPQCPTRTKSAPSFSSLSEKNGTMEEEEERMTSEEVKRGRSTLREKEGVKIAGSDRLRHRLVKSASMLFNSRGSVPSQSSPAPIKRRSTGRFDYDETLTTTKAIKSAISLSRLPDVCKDSSDSLGQSDRVLSTSAPASTNCLLGNFEESILNGRLEPAGVVEGFSIDIGASGKFCPRHVSLPVTAYFFNLSDDNAPSPYLGHINLDSLGKRGYHIPNAGTLQVTLFNPNKTVVKMFVVKYDLQDMPPNSQTVLRQRTVYQPVDPLSDLPSYLRYLIHLRISSSSSGKTYLHTDIRLIFARNKFELDSNEVQYKLCSYTETPVNPKYSPKR